jgi:hypothetical protein
MKCDGRQRRRPMKPLDRLDPEPECTCNGSGELPVYFAGVEIATVECCCRG